MAITASQLRQDIYRLLDRVLESGEPLEIERKGRRLRVVPDERPSRLASLEPHPDAVTGDADDLVAGAMPLSWTRDPFDRLICAHADVLGIDLATADRRVLQHHARATWS